MLLKDFRIRDPFILKSPNNKGYFIYGTTNKKDPKTKKYNFVVLYSEDLETIEYKKMIFEASNTFWGTYDFWAPEVYFYDNKYYMFASFKSKGRPRGTHILVSNTPDGVFTPLTDKPITPNNWECLDGTLFIYEKTPYIIYCREWLEVGDGEMYIQELKPDFTETIGNPTKLFNASSSPFVRPIFPLSKKYITDGPFLFKHEEYVYMLWSSKGRRGYNTMLSRSKELFGPYEHVKEIFVKDGGHASLFHDFDGSLKLVLHQPNKNKKERVQVFDFDIDKLQLDI